MGFMSVKLSASIGKLPSYWERYGDMFSLENQIQALFAHWSSDSNVRLFYTDAASRACRREACSGVSETLAIDVEATSGARCRAACLGSCMPQ